MSTGFATEASAGGRGGASVRVLAERDDAHPSASHASAHRIPGPPPFVMIATRSPRGRRLVSGGPQCRTSRRSCRSGSRRRDGTGRRRYVGGRHHRAGVRRGRALARRRAATLDSDQRLGGSHARAMWPNCGGSRTTPGTAGSRRCARRPPSTAGSRCSTDRPCRPATRTRTGRPSARRPGRAPRSQALRSVRRTPPGRAVAARGQRGVEATAVFSTPRQLGPTIRMPADRQTASSSRCRAHRAPHFRKAGRQYHERADAVARTVVRDSTTCAAGTAITASSRPPARPAGGGERNAIDLAACGLTA